jgi:hypothetical protein
MTLALVLILGAGVYATNGRPTASRDRQPAKINQQRSPASILKVSPTSLNKLNQTVPSISTLDLECLGQQKVIRLNSEAQQMRLIGKNCKSHEGELIVRNITNGFEASIFKRGQRKFSSDYLALNKGTNAIHVSYLNNGVENLVAELVVTRK